MRDAWFGGRAPRSRLLGSFHLSGAIPGRDDAIQLLKPARAAMAIAHKILVAIYHMFSQQVSYNDLGDLYLDQLNQNRLTRNLVHRLERLGYAVTLTLQPQAA